MCPGNTVSECNRKTIRRNDGRLLLIIESVIKTFKDKKKLIYLKFYGLFFVGLAVIL